MTLSSHFTIRPEHVVHETIEGETIIIHLESGTYYSLSGAGAEVWGMLAEGRSTEEVVQELERRYDESPQELARATEELVAELQHEQLLENGRSPGAGEQASPGPSHPESNGRIPFTPPKLQKYTDMQYFLQLDPIHEVDEAGWPNLPSERPSS